MLFMVVTVSLAVLMYLFVQRVVVMKPVGIAGVDEAIDQLIERQRKKRRVASASWASTTLSEHTMEIIESLEATTCPIERSEEASSTATTATPMQASCASSAAAATAAASTARSMGSAVGKTGDTPVEFDKTFDPSQAAVARKEEEAAEGEKKHHRHHHKRHHRHRSRGEEREKKPEPRVGCKESSEDSAEEGEGEEGGRRSKHKRHRRHRSKDAAPTARLDTPLLVAGETLPGPDAVDVEIRGGQEALKTP